MADEKEEKQESPAEKAIAAFVNKRFTRIFNAALRQARKEPKCQA
jgi:hypothetical protein